MSEQTVVGGQRRTRRGPVWPVEAHRGPGERPIAPSLPRPLPLLGPTAHGACDWSLTIAHHQGGSVVQSP